MSDRRYQTPEEQRSSAKPPKKDRWWPWHLLEVAGTLAPVAFGLGLAGTAFVWIWRGLRSSRVGFVLATFAAAMVAVALLGFVLAVAMSR